ncbi:MAG: tripartite tricarboxylate transporter TctB family protein [Chloroflexota bacterium]
MRRDWLDVGFTVALMALIGWTTFEAGKWDARARLFPWVAGIPVLVLLTAQLVSRLRGILVEPRGPRLFEEAGVDARVAARRTLGIAGWMLAFAALIWLIGFGVGGTLATLIYLKGAAREKWPVTAVITVGTGIFFWAMITFLHVPFPRGVLGDLLPY